MDPIKKNELIEACLQKRHEGTESQGLQRFLSEQGLSELECSEIIRKSDHLYLSDIRKNPPKTAKQRVFFPMLVLFGLLALMVMVFFDYYQVGIVVLILVWLSLRKFRSKPTSSRNTRFQHFKK